MALYTLCHADALCSVYVEVGKWLYYLSALRYNIDKRWIQLANQLSFNWFDRSINQSGSILDSLPMFRQISLFTVDHFHSLPSSSRTIDVHKLVTAPYYNTIPRVGMLNRHATLYPKHVRSNEVRNARHFFRVVVCHWWRNLAEWALHPDSSEIMSCDTDSGTTRTSTLYALCAEVHCRSPLHRTTVDKVLLLYLKRPCCWNQCSNYGGGGALGGPGPLSSGSAPHPHYRLALRACHKASCKLSDNSTTDWNTFYFSVL